MKLWSFDTEHFLTEPGIAAPPIVCGSWADETGEWIGDPEECLAFLEPALAGEDHLVGVWLAHDLVVMAAQWPHLVPLIFQAGDEDRLHDVSIREALNDIALGELREEGDEESAWNRYGMAVLMDRHFGTDIRAEKKGDVWRLKYGRLHGIPITWWPDEARDYPKRDARRTYDLCVRQRSYRNKHDEPPQVRASVALKLMATWGMRTDGAYVDTLDADVERVWQQAREEFAAAGLFSQTKKGEWKRSNKALQARITAAYQGRPPRTKTGVAYDRDTLVESGDPLLIKLGSSGKNDKRRSTYIPALRLGVDRPAIPNFNVLVATGRLSSDWQQMPKNGGIREGVIARPGTVNSSNDYSGMELRTMAQRAIDDPDVGFSKMADAMNAGTDVHTYVAAYFLGCTYEATLARVKTKDPIAVAYRALAKVFNFGKGGGMGAGAMAYHARLGKDDETTTGPDGTIYTGTRFCLLTGRAKTCGAHRTECVVQWKKKRVCAVCIRVAKDLGARWLKAWPEQGLLFAKAGRLTAGNKRAESITFGSQRRRGGCTYAQWLNNPFQGAGGDICKAAMYRIAKEIYTDRRSPLRDSRLILNVHDELWMEHPDDQRRHDAPFRAAQIMVEEGNRVTPDATHEVVPAIMRRMFKSASDKYDALGLLRPWWPPDAGKVWAWAADQDVMAIDLAA